MLEESSVLNNICDGGQDFQESEPDAASQSPAARLTEGGRFLCGGILTGTSPTLIVGGNFVSGAFRIPFCISPTSSLIFSLGGVSSLLSLTALPPFVCPRIFPSFPI